MHHTAPNISSPHPAPTKTRLAQVHDETLRRIFRDSLADDALGIGARREGEQIKYGYPVAVLAARKA